MYFRNHSETDSSELVEDGAPAGVPVCPARIPWLCSQPREGGVLAGVPVCLLRIP